MKIVIDMNLSPKWCGVFEAEGWQAVHWSGIGDYHASDAEIMNWSAENGYVVFTHDLDFGALLAATKATAPSVIQVRTQNVLPDHLGPLVIQIIRNHQQELLQGALIVVHPNQSRIRILPLGPK